MFLWSPNHFKDPILSNVVGYVNVILVQADRFNYLLPSTTMVILFRLKFNSDSFPAVKRNGKPYDNSNTSDDRLTPGDKD